jgi:hypothetical protein
MASRNDAFQEFVLTFQSPWNLAGLTEHRWSQSFYVSGTITHDDVAAEAAGVALAQPALELATSATSLIGITYYPTGSLVSTVNKTYPPTTHPGTGSAYAQSATNQQQLEVSAVAHCPIGKNTRGKEIYLRKYFHDVAASAADRNALNPLTSASALLAPFNTGAGPHEVVPVSPTSGHQGGPWTMETHLYTHQLRKGKKHKKVAVSSSVFSEVVQLVGYASAAKFLIDAGKAISAAG